MVGFVVLIFLNSIVVQETFPKLRKGPFQTQGANACRKTGNEPLQEMKYSWTWSNIALVRKELVSCSVLSVPYLIQAYEEIPGIENLKAAGALYVQILVLHYPLTCIFYLTLIFYSLIWPFFCFMHWTVHDRCSNLRLRKKGEISSIFQQLVFWKILMAFYSDAWIKIDIKLKRILKWITLHNS